MSALNIWRYDGREVRTIKIDGEPWFVLADLCAVLGVSNARDVAARLAYDQKGVGSIDTPGGRQQMTIVNESGMYEVVMRSDKTEAVAFRRWITGDVLPAIRTTGTYSTATALTEDQIIAQALQITTARVTALETRVAELEPVAAHAETFRQADGLRTVPDVANDFKAHCAQNFPGVKVKHRDVWDHAGRLGIVIRGDNVRHNQPTAQAIEAGWARPHRSTYDTNTRGTQTSVTTRLTPRGESRLWDGLAAWLGARGDMSIRESR